MVRAGSEEPFFGFSAGESMSWPGYAYAFLLVGVAVLLVPLASRSPIARVAAGILLLTMLLAFFRADRTGVFAADDSLVVRSLWRTHRIAWSDVIGVKEGVVGAPDTVVVHTKTGDVSLASRGSLRKRRDPGLEYMRAEIERRQAA